MYAVIRSGGKQYRVAKDDVLELERLDGETGDKIKLDEVLMIGEAGKSPTIGDPLVSGASVTLEVLDQVRGDKIDVIKFKRRKNYHRQLGHKQQLTKVKISAISKSASKAKAAAETPAETATDTQADKE
ncbi:MAG: 50S ribosomal protein L21 [Candidatus Micropelagos sp.]|jgi:large subunit ribosomal protein L21|uniref:Large ribosomal subunit protein bL21 n=1 Tax=PS1 clade bacterium TaxID=2175152 RepID=A0A368ELH5_9PROT|nr:50S ribosomal protein L21 [Hyphomicrobiales bacterium]NCG11385.1 50S ribosomal protein L21 [Alphaproteobacteria bacterium]OUV51808.1 MAG: 50S ribosomal protein L21 [Alphaproteobacteria bacterium TMED110]RCL85700.1 MAG: 50S ribosomal protein L21 [PS1 clade bacterium]HCN31551.1 50S ribosomal protein L21 [Rhodobiaceae bacterium]